MNIYSITTLMIPESQDSRLDEAYALSLISLLQRDHRHQQLAYMIWKSLSVLLWLILPWI